MIDLPIVENYNNSFPGGAYEKQCVYIASRDSYYVYLNGQWVQALPQEEEDIYTLKYKSASSDTWNTYTTSNWEDIIREFYHSGREDVKLYRGGATQPSQKCRIVPSTGNTYEDFATIEVWELIDDIYTWNTLAVIFPKIVYNNGQIIDHLNFNNLLTNTAEECYFNNVLVHKLFKDIQLSIQEKSSPVDSSIGYQPGEKIKLDFILSYYGNLSIPSLHIWSPDTYNFTFNSNADCSAKKGKYTFTREYTVTEKDTEELNKNKVFIQYAQWNSSFTTIPDINKSCALTINIAKKILYWDLTYTDSNNNTVTTRYEDYLTLKNFLTNTSLKFTDVSIEEGYYYG